jgi:hypothetical protein
MFDPARLEYDIARTNHHLTISDTSDGHWFAIYLEKKHHDDESLRYFREFYASAGWDISQVDYTEKVVRMKFNF